MPLGDNFKPSTISSDVSKGGIYIVLLTVPPELQSHYGKKQLKKSTGERELKKAKRKQHDITENWYREFRVLLGKDEYAELIELLKIENVFYGERFHPPKINYPEDAGDFEPLNFTKRPQDRREAFDAIKGINKKIREVQTAAENHDVFWELDNGIAEKKIGRLNYINDILELQKRVVFELQQQFPDDHSIISTQSSDKTPLIALNKTNYPCIREFIKPYMSSRKWQGITQKQKKSNHTRIERCIDIIGDLPLDQVTANHAFQIAEALEKNGKANATIKSHVSALSGLLKHVQLFELNTEVIPVKPWLLVNPFYGLPLSKYGKPKKSFEALSHDQLHRLFAQEMEPNDRLCLELLITTGCRLNEIALLTWEQIKIDGAGIRYIDLATNALVKNKNSKRLVPIPHIIHLPKRNSGRLFDYKIKNNNASNDAGDHLRNKYIYPIRNGPEDDRKTVHSLRHNLVGFLDNLNPPVAESLKDWITGHGSEGALNDSERKRTYGSDPDLSLKYEALNRIKHPWLEGK